MALTEQIHTFENGLMLFDRHLTPQQRARYRAKNLHEPEEEEIFLSAIRSLPTGGLFASVGTAIGYYAILAAKTRPDLEIHCFDPHPKHVVYMGENFELNGLGDLGIQIHQIAVSDRSGMVNFLDNSFASSVADISHWRFLINRMRGILSGRFMGHAPVARFQVPAKTLCDAIKLIARSSVDLLQMDIQGHECAVLMDFFKHNKKEKKHVQEFLIGTHGQSIHFSCRELFLKNGYALLADSPICDTQPDGILHSRYTHLS
jgi:FkbM family methyltransferase